MDQTRASPAELSRDHEPLRAPALRVAVAIPTYLREAVLVETIRQVLKQQPAADEVLVIDQTVEHEHETAAYLGREHESGRIRWIRQSPPNLPKARNRALSETSCDIVVFIDDDVELPSGFVEAHRRNYADASVHAVSGRIEQRKISPPNRTSWPAELDFLYLPLDSRVCRERVANFMGANHSVRRDSVLLIGGYDENYIYNGFREDTDVAIRLHRAGLFVRYDPDAWLTHLQITTGGCQSRAASPHPEWTRSFGDNYFMLRNFFPGRWYWNFVLWKHFKKYVLTKKNARAPWKVPWAVLSYFYSVYRAARVVRRGVAE